MEPRTRPGLKESQLRKLAVCSKCGEKIMANDLNTKMFTVVKIDTFMVDLRNLQRQDGLALMVGSPYLAMHMGPDDDMAKSIKGEVAYSLCVKCTLSATVAELVECGNPVEA